MTTRLSTRSVTKREYSKETNLPRLGSDTGRSQGGTLGSLYKDEGIGKSVVTRGVGLEEFTSKVKSGRTLDVVDDYTTE